MAEPLTVVIADDHPMFRRGLRALLSGVPGVEVVGEAADGVTAARLVEDLRPRLVLMDLQMPVGDGLTAVRRLSVTAPDTRILVVTMFDDDDSVFAALRAGARGYALKDADDDEMVRAVLAVGDGVAVFSPGVAARILTYFGNPPARPAEPFPELTPSELRVLRLVSRGLVNDDIAAELGLSPKTVRNYVSSVFAKLHVAGRAQAVARARDAGLG